MIYKHQYTTKEERQKIITDNSQLYLIEEQNIVEGNFLIFSDEPWSGKEVIYTNIPKEELENLKQEKTTLQLALAETIEKQEIDKIQNQIALAELLETLITREVL